MLLKLVGVPTGGRVVDHPDSVEVYAAPGAQPREGAGRFVLNWLGHLSAWLSGLLLILPAAAMVPDVLPSSSPIVVVLRNLFVVTAQPDGYLVDGTVLAKVTLGAGGPGALTGVLWAHVRSGTKSTRA